MNTFRKSVCALLIFTMVLGVMPLGEVAPFLNEAPFSAVAYATAGDAVGEELVAAPPVPSAEPIPAAPVEAPPAEQAPAEEPNEPVNALAIAIPMEGVRIDEVWGGDQVERGALKLTAVPFDASGDIPYVEGEFEFQWQSNENGGDPSSWVNIDNETASVLDILSGSDLVLNGMMFGCIVKQKDGDAVADTIGPDDSRGDQFEVNAEATNLVDESNSSTTIDAYEGDPITLTVALSANAEAKTFEWRSRKQGETGWSSPISGADPSDDMTSCTLDVTAGLDGDDMEYQCYIVEETYASIFRVQTYVITLNVYALPTITISPSPDFPWVDGETQNTALEASITGGMPGEAGYRWQISPSGETGFNNISPAASGLRYPITNPVAGDRYKYVLYDGENNILKESNAITLGVAPKLAVTIIDPVVQTVEIGASNVRFTASYEYLDSEDVPIVSLADITWEYYNGTVWAAVPSGYSVAIGSNQTTTLTLPSVTTAMNAYQFRCTIEIPNEQTAITSADNYGVLNVNFMAFDSAFIVTGTVGQPIKNYDVNDYNRGNQKPERFVLTGSGNLPPGIVFDDITGIISGTPTAAADSAKYITISAYRGNDSPSVISVYFHFAEAAPTRYTVYIENRSGGQAYANQRLALPGDDVTLTAVPYSGYTFNHWELNGVRGVNTRQSTVTFKMPYGDVYVTPYFTSVGSSGGSGSYSYGTYGGVSGSWTLTPLGLYAIQSGFNSNTGYSGTNYPSASGMTTYNVPSAYPGVTYPSTSSYAGTTYPSTYYPGTTSAGTSITGGTSSSSADPLAGVGVTQRSVTIYDSASTSGKKLGTLSKGKGVMVLGYSGNFARVRFDGQTGYIPIDDVKTAFNKPFIASTNARIPVYTEMSESSSSRYTTLDTGARVSVIGICGKWLIIAGAGGKVLYALSSGFNT